MNDPFLQKHLETLHSRLWEIQQGLVSNRFEKLEDVVRLQGQHQGITEAIQSLENAYREADL